MCSVIILGMSVNILLKYNVNARLDKQLNPVKSFKHYKLSFMYPINGLEENKRKEEEERSIV